MSDESGSPSYVTADPWWGLTEIAAYCEVVRPTADQWRHRGVLPSPDHEAPKRPTWRPETIIRFADASGRRPIAGKLWRFTAHTAVWGGASGTVQAQNRDQARAAVDRWAWRLGVRPSEAFTDEHDTLIVTVWDADWNYPRLRADTPVEYWDWLIDDQELAPRRAWRTGEVVGDVREGDGGVSVRIGRSLVQRYEWSRLRLPGSPTTLTGGTAQESEQPRPRDRELFADYDPELLGALVRVETLGFSLAHRFDYSWFGGMHGQLGTHRGASSGYPNSVPIRNPERDRNAEGQLTRLRGFLADERAYVEDVRPRFRVGRPAPTDEEIAAVRLEWAAALDHALDLAVPSAIRWIEI